MGMGLQFAVNHCGMVTLGFEIADNGVESKNKLLKEAVFDFKQNQKPMDQMLEECSRESLRTTMIRHESIFKEQVAELHRLYGVQKKMMAELSKEVGFHCRTSAATGAFSDMKSGFRTNGSTTSIYSLSYIDRSFDFMNHPNPTYKFHQMYQKSASSSTGELGFYSGDDLFNSQREPNLLRLSADMTSRQEYSQVSGRNLEGEIKLEREDLSADKDDIDLDLSLSIGCRRNHQKKRLSWKKNDNCSLQRPSFDSQRHEETFTLKPPKVVNLQEPLRTPARKG